MGYTDNERAASTSMCSGTQATCVLSILGSECCFYGKLTQWVNIQVLSFKLLKALGTNRGSCILESCVKNWFFFFPFSKQDFLFKCCVDIVFNHYFTNIFQFFNATSLSKFKQNKEEILHSFKLEEALCRNSNSEMQYSCVFEVII